MRYNLTKLARKLSIFSSQESSTFQNCPRLDKVGCKFVSKVASRLLISKKRTVKHTVDDDRDLIYRSSDTYRSTVHTDLNVRDFCPPDGCHQTNQHIYPRQRLTIPITNWNHNTPNNSLSTTNILLA